MLYLQYGLTEQWSALVFLFLAAAYVISTPIVGKTVGQPVSMTN